MENIQNKLRDASRTDKAHEVLLNTFGSKAFDKGEYDNFRIEFNKLNHFEPFLPAFQTLCELNAITLDHQETSTFHSEDGVTYLYDDGAKVTSLNPHQFYVGEYDENGKRIVGILKGRDVKYTHSYYVVNRDYAPCREAAFDKERKRIKDRMSRNYIEIKNLKQELAYLDNVLYNTL